MLFFCLFLGIFLLIFRSICSKRVFPYQILNPALLVSGEFAVGKKTHNDNDKKDDEKIFHRLGYLQKTQDSTTIFLLLQPVYNAEYDSYDRYCNDNIK
jgi:hypothetical protein